MHNGQSELDKSKCNLFSVLCISMYSIIRIYVTNFAENGRTRQFIPFILLLICIKLYLIYLYIVKNIRVIKLAFYPSIPLYFISIYRQCFHKAFPRLFKSPNAITSIPPIAATTSIPASRQNHQSRHSQQRIIPTVNVPPNR